MLSHLTQASKASFFAHYSRRTRQVSILSIRSIHGRVTLLYASIDPTYGKLSPQIASGLPGGGRVGWTGRFLVWPGHRSSLAGGGPAAPGGSHAPPPPGRRIDRWREVGVQDLLLLLGARPVDKHGQGASRSIDPASNLTSKSIYEGQGKARGVVAVVLQIAAPSQRLNAHHTVGGPYLLDQRRLQCPRHGGRQHRRLDGSRRARTASPAASF